jgi:hypothetical protein
MYFVPDQTDFSFFDNKQMGGNIVQFCLFNLWSDGALYGTSYLSCYACIKIVPVIKLKKLM